MRSRASLPVGSIALVLLAGLGSIPAHAQYTNETFLEPPDDQMLVGLGDWASDLDYQAALVEKVSPASHALPGLKKVRLSLGVVDDSLEGHPSYLTTEACFAQIEAAAGTSDHARLPELVIYLLDSKTNSAIDNQLVPGDLQYNPIVVEQIHNIGLAIERFGRPVLVCIGQEFNNDYGPQGHSQTNYHPYTFPKAFQITRDIINSYHVRCAFVWTWAAFAPTDWFAADGTDMKWYPGDPNVDWFGLDVFPRIEFTDGPLPATTCLGPSKLLNVAAFLAEANSRGCPVIVEASAVDVGPTGIVEGPYDTSNALGCWFQHFFDFLRLDPSMKAVVYMSKDWTPPPNDPYGGGGGACWRNARIEINDAVMTGWVQELETSDVPAYMGESCLSNLNGYDGWWGLNNGLPGACTPKLVGSGEVRPGSVVSLDLTGAMPTSSSTFTFLVYGLTSWNHPWQGGTLVPTPTWMTVLPTTAEGSIHLSWTWPTYPVDEIYYQYWTRESTSPLTYSASNAVKAHTLPF